MKRSEGSAEGPRRNLFSPDLSEEFGIEEYWEDPLWEEEVDYEEDEDRPRKKRGTGEGWGIFWELDDYLMGLKE